MMSKAYYTGFKYFLTKGAPDPGAIWFQKTCEDLSRDAVASFSARGLTKPPPYVAPVEGKCFCNLLDAVLW